MTSVDDWLSDWIEDYVEIGKFVSNSNVKEDAARCIDDALADGIDLTQLIEAVGGDLDSYFRARRSAIIVASLRQRGI